MKFTLRHRWAANISLVLAMTGHAQAEVEIDDAQRKDIGVETATLALSDIAPVWHATAKVLDPAPLIAQLSELKTAQSTANASKQELDRLEQLYKAETNVSLKALEAARVQNFTDAGHLETLRAQLATSWGAAFMRMDQPEHERFIKTLLSGDVALIRAETIQAVAADADMHSARLQSLSDNRSWNAQVVAALPQSNGQVIGNAYLLQVPARLQPGSLLAAELRDGKHAQRRIKVPRSAIVRWQGSTWLFVESEPNVFAREPVQIDDCFDQVCVLKDGMQPGQRIATVGVALLLAAETSHPAGD